MRRHGALLAFAISTVACSSLARASWANITQAKASIVIECVQEHDAGAGVTYSETHDILVVDPHRVEYDGHWFASLTRTADGWRIVHSRELRRAVKIDGSLIDDTQSKH